MVSYSTIYDNYSCIDDYSPAVTVFNQENIFGDNQTRHHFQEIARNETAAPGDKCKVVHEDGNCGKDVFPAAISMFCPLSCGKCVENKKHIEAAVVRSEREDRAAKRFEIDLGKPPKERYTDLVFNYAASLRALQTVLQKQVHWQGINPVPLVEAVAPHIAKEFKEEMEGMATQLEFKSWHEVLRINLL
jgi:hypothetical protein